MTSLKGIKIALKLTNEILAEINGMLHFNPLKSFVFHDDAFVTILYLKRYN